MDVIANAGRQGAQISFEWDLENLFMTLKPLAMRRCLMNVLSNAGKYAGHIWVTLSTHGENTVRIVIEDNGVGIPEDQYEAVFRPFYRVDSSRNTDTGGVGLGLPIAMDIVHAHGGEISLGRSKHGGLVVTIVLRL